MRHHAWLPLAALALAASAVTFSFNPALAALPVVAPRVAAPPVIPSAGSAASSASSASASSASERAKPGWVHAYAAFGEPKYRRDFSHFEYANPQAPKGGTLYLKNPDRRTSFDKFIST